VRWKYRLNRIDVSALRRIFGHFGGHLAQHKARLGLSVGSLIGVALITLLRPWPLKVVFDNVLMTSRSATTGAWNQMLNRLDPVLLVALCAFAVLLLAALTGLLKYSQSVLTKTVGHSLVAQIRLQLFSHVQRLPQSYHDYRETGDLMTRMTSDIGLLEELLTTSVISMATQVLLIAGMFGIMLWMDWQLALVTIAVAPLFLIAAFRFSVRIKQSARRQREAYGKIVASVQESLAGILQVKTYGQEKKREKLIGKSMSRDVKANVKTTRLAANYARVVELITAVGTGLVLFIGALKVRSGVLSAGDLLVFVSYVRSIYRPVRDLAQLSTKVAKATVRGEKIIELMEMQPEVADQPGAVSAGNIEGALVFDHVDFAYVGGSPVLKDFSCHIPAKKTTVVLGHTGAGKSTLAKLVLRLYDPVSGSIHLDGHNITDYRIRSLRKRITPLSQETFLFRTTIEENIGFGMRRIDPDAIVAAARIAGAHEFISNLPEGYQTLVGEGGLTLSGGQRQRISFARAALRKSPVMIFDEPATGLDPRSEQETKSELLALRHDRTLMIITHRLHFLDLADWVIMIDGGRMVEEGTPADLKSRAGAFVTFLAHETSGLADPAAAIVSHASRSPEGV
jgi:ATP-binding cassette subfamily B protein